MKEFIKKWEKIFKDNKYEMGSAFILYNMSCHEKYQELKPDLVTMDITMPEMDGITALKKIKAIDPSAKIIMCSAMGQQAMVIDAIQAGAKDFIVKPFNADRVIEAIKKTLG